MSSPKRAVVALVVAVVAIVLVATSLSLRDASEPPERVVSAEGGFSIEVPSGWSVDHRHPTDPDHMEFVVGEGEGEGDADRGGFWVARWGVPETTRVSDLQARMRSEDPEIRRNRVVASSTLAGMPAAIVSYVENTRNANARQKNVFIREIVVDGFVFQVGTWAISASGNARTELNRIAASFALRTPRAWAADLRGVDATLRLPGGWVERKTDLPAAVFYAVSPGEPSAAWVYVFHNNDKPDVTLAKALRSIPASKGKITSQPIALLDGRPAKRIDYTTPDGPGTLTHNVEWIADNGSGGSYVLIVGRRNGDAGIAEKIAATWKF